MGCFVPFLHAKGGRNTPSVRSTCSSSCCCSLLLSLSADVRAADDVIAFEGRSLTAGILFLRPGLSER